jgi:hypothetical protein
MRQRLVAVLVAVVGESFGCVLPLAQATASMRSPAMLGETIATLTAESPISAGQGWLIWSAPEGGGWTLHAYHAGLASVVQTSPRPEPFDATVGTDAKGRAVAVFSRCSVTPKMSGTGPGGVLEHPSTGHGCRIHDVELATGRESLVPIPHTPGSSDTTPAMWHGVVAFARREPQHGLVSQILAWSPRHPRALVSLPHGFVPSECNLSNCKGFFGYGEAQALTYDGSTVAFVWEPKESLQSVHENSEDRVDTVSSRHGRVVGDAGTSESCMGEAGIEEEHSGTPFLLGTSAYFPTVERGDCYKSYGSRMLVARPRTRLEANLSTPVLAWAADGDSTFALVAQVPTEEEEAHCASASPCTLQMATLPKLHPSRYSPGHAFFG